MKMKAVLYGTIGSMSISDYSKRNNSLSFGGYDFAIDRDGTVINVPFDFMGYSANVQNDGSLLLVAGADTLFFKNNDRLDDCYDCEYEKLGITREDLTAEVLASAVKINEFCIDCDYPMDLTIKSIMFIDDDTREYEMDEKVIDEFNMAQERNIW